MIRREFLALLAALVAVAPMSLAHGKALQALMGGSADMTSGSFEHTINMQAKGQSIEAIVLQGRYPAIALGMKIGVTAPGSPTNLFVSNLLAKDGLPPDSASIIGVRAAAGAVVTMKMGELDAISNLDPVIHQLEVGGDIVAVVDTRTARGTQQVYGGAYHAGCIYATTDFVKKNPNTTQAVVNAMVRAVRWLQKATPDQIVATVPPEYYGDDKANYKAALQKNLAALSPDVLMTMEGAKNVYNVLNAFEPSVKAEKIELAKTFDNSFSQKALVKYR